MKILMCADGSEISENAIEFGGLLAKGLNAKVTLLHVVEDPRHDRSKDILKRAKNILKDLGLEIKIKVMKGVPELKIIKETEKEGYQLLILGSHGMEGLKVFFFGDVAYRVIEHVKIPVLIVREKKVKLEKILMCCGGSKYAEEAIRFGGNMAKASNSKVTLLHVIPEIPVMYKGLRMDETLKGFLKTDTPEAKLLKHSAKMLSEKGLDVDVELRHGLPPEEILDQAEEGDYDMITIGSHGMFGIRRFLMGAVAYQVVKHAKLPCLLVKPKKFRFLSSTEAY